MRLPRDLSGDELIRLLEKFGYFPVRQKGKCVISYPLKVTRKKENTDNR